MIRKITLLAEGVVGSQLPNLEAQQNHEDFGVYADKPAMGEDVDGKTGAIIGWRKESYSLIPRKAGRLFLPAVKVKWWDVVNNKIATTEMPGRKVTCSACCRQRHAGWRCFRWWAQVGGLMPSRSASAQSFWVRIHTKQCDSDVLDITVLIRLLVAALAAFAKKTASRARKKIGAERT